MAEILQGFSYTPSRVYAGLARVAATCAATRTMYVYDFTVRSAPAPAPVAVTRTESCVAGAAKATTELTFTLRNRDTEPHLWSITSTSFLAQSGKLAGGAETTAVVVFTDASATVHTHVEKALHKIKTIANRCTATPADPKPGSVGGVSGIGAGNLAGHHPGGTPRYE